MLITGRRESELSVAVREIGRNVTGVQGDVADLGDLDSRSPRLIGSVSFILVSFRQQRMIVPGNHALLPEAHKVQA